MSRELGLPDVEEWIQEVNSIQARTDLTEEQKVTLVEQRYKYYKEQHRLLLDGEEQRRAELRKSMSPREQSEDKRAWIIERAVREGRILIKPFPLDDQEETEGDAGESKE